MITIIFKFLSALLFLGIGSMLLKDLMNYLFWLRHYKSQGVSYTYIPLLGINYFFVTPLHKFFDKDISLLEKFKLNYIKGSDMIAKFRQLAARKQNEDVIAVTFEKTAPILLLQNPDLVAEFLQKENETCIRVLTVTLPTDVGFITQNGAHGMSRRQIFAKFFYPDKLQEFTPQIASTIQEVLENVKKGFGGRIEEFPESLGHKREQEDGFKSVNVRKILLEIFSKMVENILFGSKREVKIDGMSLPEACDLLFDYGFSQV